MVNFVKNLLKSKKLVDASRVIKILKLEKHFDATDII
jgi:hypothetical protein